MKTLTLHFILASLVLSGCSLFGKGKDSNRLTVENKGCEVTLSQLGKVTGLDQTTLMESVTVEPDCTVTINVEDAVGPLRSMENDDT